MIMQFKKSCWMVWAALMICCCSLSECAVAETTSAETTKRAERLVMLVSIDGLGGYYLDDAKAEMPTLRRLAAEGVRAAGMKASAPTVTWPNHTTMMTGVHPARHGVLGNNYLDRATRRKVTLLWDPVLDMAEIVRAPTIFDVAKERGMTTAAVRWPATRNAGTLDWNVPDVGTYEHLRQFSTPVLHDALRAAGVELDGDADDPRGQKFTPTDVNWTKVMRHVLREHRPELALFHLVDVDHIEHADGPRSREAYAAIKQADEHLRMVVDDAKELYPGGVSVVVVSDHGFSPIVRGILPNVVLREAGLIEENDGEVVGGDVEVVGQGGSALVYVLDDVRRVEIVDKIKQAFAEVEGVDKVVGVEEFGAYGIPDPQDDPHAPDVILFAGMGYNFGDTTAGAIPFEVKPERKGSHGHDPNLPELKATFVAWGKGVRRGVEIPEVENTCVAPTLARLLGIEMAGCDGAAVEAALE